MDRIELAIIVLGVLIVINAWLVENALKRIKILENDASVLARAYLVHDDNLDELRQWIEELENEIC